MLLTPYITQKRDHILRFFSLKKKFIEEFIYSLIKKYLNKKHLVNSLIVINGMTKRN